jgi:DNA-binding GntR family transcriptional regulator
MPMHQPSPSKEAEKAPVLVVQRVREEILAEVLKPGDHLGESELAEKFEVSRSPVREALVSLEKEGTVITSPYKGAIVRPWSAAEILDIAELRLALISLVLKPAYRHLSPADLDRAYDLAKRLTRVNNAKDFFEYNWQFWESIFSKAQRPISPEVFRQLEERMARYYPLLLKLFPTARPSEILMEMYREGKIVEAFRAFKKIYLEIVAGVIDHLKSQEAGDSSRRVR